MMRNQKGITLIALVITIIVLLILAGVSIAMLTGENGILTNASNSKKETAEKGAIERINLALNAIKTEVLAEQATDPSYDATEHTSDLVLTKVTGITSGSDGYTVNAAEGAITITFVDDTVDVNVTGSIDLAGSNGGTITPAAVTAGS